MKRELKEELQWLIRNDQANRKAHPDEKGTERGNPGSQSLCSWPIARLIPMKRELKGEGFG